MWPGQLLSLACVAAGLIVVGLALARRFGEPAACGAFLLMLGHQGTIAMATSIQPDALSFLAFAVGLVAFLDYLDAPSTRRLVLWVGATAIAGLVKPTTLELGVAQFVLVVLTGRYRDRQHLARLGDRDRDRRRVHGPRADALPRLRQHLRRAERR